MRIYWLSLVALLLVTASCAHTPTHEPAATAEASKPTTTPAAQTNAQANVGENRTPAATTNAEADVEAEFKKLMELDDAAHAEVDKWIKENQSFAAQGAGTPDAELNKRIRDRLAPVQKGYEDFIRAHPNHVGARLTFASFLDDLHDEDTQAIHLEAAMSLAPTNPAVWNQLANYYGHIGEAKKAFDYYAKAIELEPTEPVYYHNYGTTVYLFRKDAREHFGIEEQQVFDKALCLYSNAMRLDPKNFQLASDVAQSYYGIKPTRLEDALVSWTNALNIATTEIEREGVYLHLARMKMHAERFEEARAHIKAVSEPIYDELKSRLTRSLADQEAKARTNSPAGKPE